MQVGGEAAEKGREQARVVVSGEQQSRAEQGRAGQSRAEQGRAGQSSAGLTAGQGSEEQRCH